MSEQITSAAEWRKEATEIVTCPSGAKIELRRISKDTLIISRRLPSTLLAQVVRALDGADSLGGGAQLTDQQIADVPALADAVIIHAVKRPRVVLENAGEGEMNLDDIPEQDRFFIYHRVLFGSPQVPVALENGGETTIENVAEFPDGEQLPDSPRAGESSTDLRAEAEQAVGNS